MAQNPDVGTQYRGGIYINSGQQYREANLSLKIYQRILTENGLGKIQTEVLKAEKFYYAEKYHQQYKAKNPEGQCAEGLGISCPIGNFNFGSNKFEL
jgi:peptide-methionine (S)-S-oxide reductase